VCIATTNTIDVLNSPLDERSAMAVLLQMPGCVVVKVDACNEAEARSCRVRWNSAGKLRVPSVRRPGEKVGRLAAQRVNNGDGRPQQLQEGKWGK
jgi:hypothetical protein